MYNLIKTKNNMKKTIFLVLLGLMCSVGMVWGQTTLYSWEGGDPSATETGGTASVLGSDDALNVESITIAGTYHVIQVASKKKNVATSHTEIALTTSLQEGDLVKISGFQNKDASDKTVTIYLKFLSDNTNKGEIADNANWVNLNNNPTYANAEEPEIKTFEVTEAMAGSNKIYITRNSSGTNLWISKIEIIRPKAVSSKVLTGININGAAWDIAGLSDNAATISTSYTVIPAVQFVYTINYTDETSETNQTQDVTATKSGDNYVAASTVLTTNVTLTFTNVNVYEGVTPTGTLDLSNAASTTFATTWYTDNNMIKNSYYDAPNGIVTFSAYALYQGRASQTWVDIDGSGSTDDTWSATGSFKGNSYYFSESSKAATARAATRIYYYRVTNCTGASALMKGKAIMEAYEVSAGVVTPSPVKNSSIDAAGTLSLSGLDKDKEYIIKVRGNNGNSNVVFDEVAFSFPAVTSVSKTISAAGWATYCSPYALDFSSTITNLEAAYIVTGASGDVVSLVEVTGTVPAGTGLLLKGNGDCVIPVVASSSTDVSANKLIGKTAEYTLPAGEGYVLLKENGVIGFYINENDAFTVGANTAYLPANFAETNAPSAFRLVDEENNATNIENVEANEKAVKFIENGRILILRDGITYDALGRVVR